MVEIDSNQKIVKITMGISNDHMILQNVKVLEEITLMEKKRQIKLVSWKTDQL